MFGTEEIEKLYREGQIDREEFMRRMRERGLSDHEIEAIADCIDEVVQ